MPSFSPILFSLCSLQSVFFASQNAAFFSYLKNLDVIKPTFEWPHQKLTINQRTVMFYLKYPLPWISVLSLGQKKSCKSCEGLTFGFLAGSLEQTASEKILLGLRYQALRF